MADARFAFTNHWISTDRFAFLTDHLTADFTAQSYGGRLEGGYRFATPVVGIAPYAALQAQSLHTPSYSETGTLAHGFALAFSSRDATDTRTEVSARFDRALRYSYVFNCCGARVRLQGGGPPHCSYRTMPPLELGTNSLC